MPGINKLGLRVAKVGDAIRGRERIESVAELERLLRLG